MTTQTIERVSRVSHAVAAEIRATLGRQGITQSELAKRINHNNAWLSTRISPTATVDMTVDEISQMADALGVEAEGIVLSALRACRDSNPKPSDLEFGGEARGVNRRLTVDRRYRDAWRLVA